MKEDERKPSDLEDRLDAYAARIRELRRGKSAKPPPTNSSDPLARLGQELQLLSEVIARREDELGRLFQVVHTIE